MANDYRILDERDIKNFQAGNKLNVTEIGNKVTYEHIGNPPDRLPLQEQILEYGKSFDITVPSVYDSTGHVKSETTYSFIMPEKADTSGSLTIDNFDADSPISVDKQNGNVTYSHNTISQTPKNSNTTSLNYGQTFSFSALSGADSYGHANEKTTYTFQMPAAPSGSPVDISKFPKTENFSADEPIIVTKDTNNNTVKYSHNSVTVGNDSDINLSPDYGDTVNFTIFSGTDGYGHVNKKAKVNLTMPASSQIVSIDIPSNAGLSYTCQNNIESSSTYCISISPNPTGIQIGEAIGTFSYYIIPGSSTLFTNKLDLECQLTLLYVIWSSSSEGFVKISTPLTIKMKYASQQLTIQASHPSNDVTTLALIKNITIIPCQSIAK